MASLDEALVAWQSSEKPVLIFDRGCDSLHESILNGDTPEDLPELRAACFGGFEIPEHTHDYDALDKKPSQKATGLRAATHWWCSGRYQEPLAVAASGTRLPRLVTGSKTPCVSIRLPS